MARRATTGTTEIDGRRAFYREVPAGPAAGAAPPLLLVHGISCCTETWAPFADALSKREDSPRLIVPDLPAHGRSACPPLILGMEDYAGWLERLLASLEVGPVDVMGHSMGCQVALALAEAHPERVRRLVLLGPTTGGKHVSAFRNFTGLVGDSAREPLRYNMTLTRVFLQMGPLRYLLTVRRMQEDDAFARARRIDAPALVLQGTRDLIVPMQVGWDLAGEFAYGAYAGVPGAAHAAQFSHPERTAEAVLSFLAREPQLVRVGAPGWDSDRRPSSPDRDRRRPRPAPKTQTRSPSARV